MSRARPFSSARFGEPTRWNVQPFGSSNPLSPVDEWWNRTFPPHSTRRLLFILAVYPLIGLLVEMGTGIVLGKLVEDGTGFLLGGFSWIRYLLITLSGMALLSLLWLSGSLGPPGVAVASAPAAPPTRRVPATGGGYRPNLADFATGVPFGVACVLSVIWATGEPLSPFTLVASLVAGAVVSATVVLRYTIWAPIVLSLVVGAGIGVFLLLFGMFMGGPQGVLTHWGIGTLIAACFVFPAWQPFHASRAARRELPMWVLMTGMLILVAAPVILLRMTA